MQILQASKYKGHLDFKGCGRQCVANAVHAFLKGKKARQMEQSTLE